MPSAGICRKFEVVDVALPEQDVAARAIEGMGKYRGNVGIAFSSSSAWLRVLRALRVEDRLT
jgi:hypothetical protein